LEVGCTFPCDLGDAAVFLFRNDDLERLRQQDRDTINKQNQALADFESELNMLRRRVNGLEQDLEHEASENKRLQEELFRTTQVK
jgi:septal ring factor EnvC (AmiA/AmiB activator)